MGKEDMDMYELIKQVGEGSFGQVFKAKRRCDNAIVAYKVTRKKGRTSKELISLRRECEIQKELRHPNIIQMIDSFETDTKIVVVTEYVEKELYEILGKAGRLSEERSQVIACDLVSALHYLHSNRIVHRDMKPQNVLLDTNGVAKLCDFGFARLMSQGTHVLMSVKGTPLYMAPELIDELPYDHNVDLWSLGCIVYELVNGTPPFQTTSMRHLVSLIRHEEIKWPEHISTNCQSFLQGLLQKDPSQRLTWPELSEHPFVKGRILTVEESAPRSLTSPLSASQARAKQQQLQSLASRFNFQYKKILERQIRKIQTQMRKSNPTESESGASVEVLLDNLSLRASLRSNLVAADHAISPVDCPIVEEDCNPNEIKKTDGTVIHDNPNFGSEASCSTPYQQQQPNINKSDSRIDPLSISTNVRSTSSQCSESSIEPLKKNIQRLQDAESTISERETTTTTTTTTHSLAKRRSRLGDWPPKDTNKPIEEEEWLVFLQQTMEEVLASDLVSVLQENCVTFFVSPLVNPHANSKVVEYVCCLLSLPFAVDEVKNDELMKVQRVYLDVKVAASLVCAVKLLMRIHDDEEKTRRKGYNDLYADELQALERALTLICRLVHTKDDFLMQFCDAMVIVPDGIMCFQQLFKLEKRKARVVSDFLGILNRILRSRTGNAEIVNEILVKDRSTDETVDLFLSLMTHKQSTVRSRTCSLLLQLALNSRKTLQQIWGKTLKDCLENLTGDAERSVHDAAIEAIRSLKCLSFYRLN